MVTHVLGTHIERKAPYVDYPIFEHYQPVEMDLQLGRASLLELLEATTLRDRHGQWLIGLRTVPPWLRYTPMAESDIVGRLRWHEPHNQTLELGLGTQIKPTCSEITCAPLGQSPRP
mgnify:CR=1 FL=1